MSKLILTSEVSGLGSAGDVVDVKNGYARNYLIPQGYAVAWTRGGEKQVESIKAARVAREHATIEEAQDLKSRLQATKVKLTEKIEALPAFDPTGSMKSLTFADPIYWADKEDAWTKQWDRIAKGA